MGKAQRYNVEGGEEWTPSAVVPRAIPLSRMPK
jgi:hypothetical protein